MAVTENVDIGSLIAGAVDRFYEQLDREQVIYEQGRQRVLAFIEQVARPRFIKARQETPRLEADAAVGPIQQAGAQPAGQTSARRKGYQAGWKSAKEGRPAQPTNSDPEYVQGYAEGHKVSGHANAVTGHYDAAIQAHQAGDREGAKQHVAQAQPHVNELVQHHMDHWGRTINIPADQFNKNIGGVMGAAAKKNVKKDGGQVIAGQRTPIVNYVHGLTKSMNAAPDDEAHKDHPATFGDQLGKIIAGYGAMAEKGEKKGAAKGAGGGDDGVPENVAPERAARAAAPEMDPEKFEAAKSEMVRNAWQPEEIKSHVAEHGNHQLAHHDTLESAKEAALAHWKDRLLRHIEGARKPGMKYDAALKVKTGKVDANGHPITTDFDVGKALTDVVSHPAGAFSRVARAAAVKKQLPDYDGKRTHPLHKVAAVMQRAENWLHGQHPHFSRGALMHNLSAGRATQYGGGRHAGLRGDQGTQSPEDAVEEALDIFESWLIDHVDIDDEQVASIMASMEDQAYARLRTVNES